MTVVSQEMSQARIVENDERLIFQPKAETTQAFQTLPVLSFGFKIELMMIALDKQAIRELQLDKGVGHGRRKKLEGINILAVFHF